LQAFYTEELGAERVVRLMCRRWGEENQIKELLLKHMINYMPGYVTEGLDEQPWVENPKVKEARAGIDQQIAEGMKSFNAEKTLAVSGVEQVVELGTQVRI